MPGRFCFRLETLLRVRQLNEREAQRRLGAKRAEIARLEELNRQAHEQIVAQQNALRAAQRQSQLDPLELSRRRAWIALLRRTISERLALRARLLEQEARLRDELRLAHQQTQTLQKLRQRRWQEYRAEQARLEQAEADEMARQLHRWPPRGTTALRQTGDRSW